MPLRTAPIRLLAASALLAAWSAASRAEAPPDRQALDRQIEQKTAEEEAARAEEAALRAEFQALQGQSVAAARDYEALDRAILLLDLQQALASTELARRAEHLENEAARLSGVLNGLVRLSQRPAVPLPFLDLSVNDQARAALALSFTSEALRRRTEAIQRELVALDEKRQELGEDRRLLETKKADLDARKQELDALSERKEELAREAAAKRGDIEEQLADLAQRSRDLAELTQKLQEEAAAKARALAAAVARAREVRESTPSPSPAQPSATGAARKPPAADAAPSGRPASSPEAVAGLDRQAAGAAGLRPASVRGFPSQAGGQLQRPLRGQLLSRFGEADSPRGRDQGLVFAAKPGALVIAPFDGQVVYAGPFRHYGLLLIIDHGGQYHSLLAGFGRLAVTSGQWVLAGEPIGWMSDTKNGQPELYLELRRGGSPIDPLPWLSSASDTTRG